MIRWPGISARPTWRMPMLTILCRLRMSCVCVCVWRTMCSLPRVSFYQHYHEDCLWKHIRVVCLSTTCISRADEWAGVAKDGEWEWLQAKWRKMLEKVEVFSGSFAQHFAWEYCLSTTNGRKLQIVDGKWWITHSSQHRCSNSPEPDSKAWMHASADEWKVWEWDFSW